ncbi:MAG: hypothetical protein NUW01_02745 [Gemmatimonadaceae bacterium]|nr:hypothetical protein [Gemmatimonadaceae bacterium]
MIVRGGDGATILSFVPQPPVEISILDLPYAQALLFAALDLLEAVESGEWDRIVEARWGLRAILDAYSVPLND